ncbi:sulfotransferase domain-containing protein [Ideonella sp.]|uniref:sulfotransferase domain-containing protein n=1 Tax=Ideonella sp. TaxID=1929293 RepID=UPI002B4720F3|nr:sulfotransferase domain-containing protein [Ideonella sp.]HJV71248.1 sulfotransferase domain-containing protein [Ideonella sp.]
MNTPIKLSLQCGREVEFDLPEVNPDHPHTTFVLGVRKSGSTLLNRLVIAIGKHYNVPFVDIGGGFFSRDLKASQWVDDLAVQEVFKPGYIFGGFRASYTHFQASPVFKESRKILLVRDPRDALVSQYFSTLKTHSLPKLQQGEGGAAEQILKQREEAAKLTVDDYVLLNARSFRRTLEGYVPLLEDDNLKLFRYEDVIEDKEPWIRRMLDVMQLPKHKGFIEKLVELNDIKPGTENTAEFIRKVTPGDHVEKLRSSTIEALNLIFEDVGRQFGYRLR